MMVLARTKQGFINELLATDESTYASFDPSIVGIPMYYLCTTSIRLPMKVYPKPTPDIEIYVCELAEVEK
jgi:hypothetical protein